MALRTSPRVLLPALLASALVAPLGTSAAAADDGRYTAMGTRAAGMAKLACTSYPSGRDINVTRKMYEIGWQRQVSGKVMLAMFEAGWVESWLNNLNCGHADSIGIFQMRPSMGWGTYTQLRDVTYQVNKFINVAKPLESKYSTAGQLAQAVERSAYPYRYDQARATAQKYINEAALPYGGIGALWRSLGGESGVLGGPLTPEHSPTTGVRRQIFSRGTAFYTSAGGTVCVRGGIYWKWQAGGGLSGAGLPTLRDEVPATSVTGTVGRKLTFQRGAIMWSPKTGARYINPAMRKAFEATGAERAVGFPVGDTTSSTTGLTQTFEKAIIKISPTGVVSKYAR